MSASLYAFRKRSSEENSHGLLYSNVAKSNFGSKLSSRHLNSNFKKQPTLLFENDSNKKIPPIIDEDDFILKESPTQLKKRRREESGYFSGANPPNIDIWIYKVVNGNCNIFYNYIKSRNIKVYSISRTSNLAAKYKSFKINISKTYMKTLLDSSFWPDGVKSNKWIEPNGKGGRPNIYW